MTESQRELSERIDTIKKQLYGLDTHGLEYKRTRQRLRVAEKKRKNLDAEQYKWNEARNSQLQTNNRAV